MNTRTGLVSRTLPVHLMKWWPKSDRNISVGHFYYLEEILIVNLYFMQVYIFPN